MTCDQFSRRCTAGERERSDAFVHPQKNSPVTDGVMNQLRPGVCAASEIGVLEAATEVMHTRDAIKAT
jgi:hypothetical protein